MSEFSWCPEPKCGQPAELDEETNKGKCTECRFKFCILCRKKFHPYERCETATIHLANLVPDEVAIQMHKDAHAEDVASYME